MEKSESGRSQNLAAIKDALATMDATDEFIFIRVKDDERNSAVTVVNASKATTAVAGAQLLIHACGMSIEQIARVLAVYEASMGGRAKNE